MRKSRNEPYASMIYSLCLCDCPEKLLSSATLDCGPVAILQNDMSMSNFVHFGTAKIVIFATRFGGRLFNRKRYWAVCMLNNFNFVPSLKERCVRPTRA